LTVKHNIIQNRETLNYNMVLYKNVGYYVFSHLSLNIKQFSGSRVTLLIGALTKTYCGYLSCMSPEADGKLEHFLLVICCYQGL